MENKIEKPKLEDAVQEAVRLLEDPAIDGILIGCVFKDGRPAVTLGAVTGASSRKLISLLLASHLYTTVLKEGNPHARSIAAFADSAAIVEEGVKRFLTQSFSQMEIPTNAVGEDQWDDIVTDKRRSLMIDPNTVSEVLRNTDGRWSAPDICAVKWQYQLYGHFYTALYGAISKADGMNMDRLALGFPDEVQGYLNWTRGTLAERLTAFDLELLNKKKEQTDEQTNKEKDR